MACDDIAHQSIQLWEEKTGLYSMTFEHSGKMARYDRRNKSFKQARSAEWRKDRHFKFILKDSGYTICSAVDESACLGYGASYELSEF